MDPKIAFERSKNESLRFAKGVGHPYLCAPPFLAKRYAKPAGRREISRLAEATWVRARKQRESLFVGGAVPLDLGEAGARLQREVQNEQPGDGAQVGSLKVRPAHHHLFQM